jgi:hypothetical protein
MTPTFLPSENTALTCFPVLTASMSRRTTSATDSSRPSDQSTCGGARPRFKHLRFLSIRHVMDAMTYTLAHPRACE